MMFLPHGVISRLNRVNVLVVWLGVGYLGLVAQITLETQYAVKGRQICNLNQKAIVEFGQSLKRDALRRTASAIILASVYPSRVSGQTTHSPPPHTLHQHISIYGG